METRTARAIAIGAAMVLALVVWSCDRSDTVWFHGTLDEATAEASKENTLVMVDFYTDWCTWCQRLEQETFADPKVREQLATLVPIKLDAEKGGAGAADRFGVDSYPTIVFVDGAGREVDRVLGYRSPADFITEIHRIRAGDTFMACLSRLDEDPADLEALERAVSGFLDRTDSGAAIERIEAFHAADDGSRADECRRLMFTARQALHEESYRLAIRAYHRGWEEIPAVANTVGTRRLHAMLAALTDTEDEALALRGARHDDAGEVLDLLPDGYQGPETNLLAGRFAFETGHYERAETLYRGWIDRRQRGDQAEYLNEVAWNLYLMERDLDAALGLAREAYERDPDPNVGDTLSRLLYRAGDVEEALRIQNEAIEAAEGRPMAESLKAAASAMADGDALGDRPTFESFPGDRRL
jgi:thioredoxin-related protein